MSMTLPPLGIATQPPATPNPVDLQQKSLELSKDLIKANVEAVISQGKMDYIATLVDMYV